MVLELKEVLKQCCFGFLAFSHQKAT